MTVGELGEPNETDATGASAVPLAAMMLAGIPGSSARGEALPLIAVSVSG
jgi:hypothetical protein